MAIQPNPPKNVWVAAGDGDLDRVKELIESHSLSPNVPDPNSYTPMHAAASYGQIEVLEYLVSRGGDVNITDDDGDTPIYTVENVDTARWLVEHGAIVDRRNQEGISPIEHLSEDFGEVANYLQTLTTTTTTSSAPGAQSPNHPSQHSQNAASEQLTSALMASVQEIMERAEAEGRDPDEELRQVVSRTVLDGVATGYAMTEDTSIRDAGRAREDPDDSPSKRSRMDGPG
ncbi:ankyrin repeat-containing domain protein [Crucibulum laeve]|uniref:Ankyrin repeat-containing domain protein n=1 Tax=Crucibulum laeve TaxID=68775 RepID=A0A5C3M4U1_9AGAR|nr:ankyrin repeat-containing domain protein [Crucibulum laeve]